MFTFYLILTIALLIIIISLVVIFFLLWSFITTVLYKVPYVPTYKKNIQLIIDGIEIKPGQVVYDLGCGDARFLLAAEKFGAKTHGYELAIWPYLKAKFYIKKSKAKTKIYRKNFYNQNLSDADLVYCFLLSKVMDKVEKKLLNELKPKTTVISYAARFPNMEPYKIIDTKPSKTYFYKI